MSDRDARIEAAADAIYECFAKARRTAPPAQPSYSDLALAALAAADAVQASDTDWRCKCGDLNRDHEAFCYRCGAGQSERAGDGKRMVDLKALLTEDAVVQAVREMRASRGAGLSHWSDDVAAAVDALD